MRFSTWFVLAFLVSGTATARAGDWPTYRADAARSGYTSEAIPNQLRERWVFHPGAAPRRAWVGSERIEYDLAFQPILVGDTVLLGSSADDTVYALDATTGLIRWRFHTEGPVRFAPVAADGRVFLASDDGWLYALDLGTGELAWKHRGGPDPDRVVGNGRVISRWAARGGPAVAGGLVYYTAGIWPSEGVFIHALSTKDGQVAWSNVDSGRIEMKQPHGGAVAVSGVAPQGYLALAEDAVVVPTGRAVPAVFDRGSGELRYYKLQENQQQGGTRTAVVESSFLNTGCLFDLASGALTSRVGLGPTVVTPTGLLRAEGRSLMVSAWAATERFDRKGNPEKVRQLVQKQMVPLESEVTEVIVAGEDAIVGGEGWVGAIDFLGQRTMWWHAPVDGVVRGLAAANGRVVVTTESGSVHLFDGRSDRMSLPAQETPPGPTVATAPAPIVTDLLARVPERRGYAVVFGVADAGSLAGQLAVASDFQVVVVDDDLGRVRHAQRALADAGLLGVRASVIHAPLAATALPPQFANLVITVETSFADDVVAEQRRIQRPFGGARCQRTDGTWHIETKGALPGAGSWTHQNANPANTLCSEDELVRGTLSMQWYGDVDFEIANRHGQGPAPVVHDGVMVVGGVDGLCAVDSFNGTVLWTHDIKGFLADYDGIHHDVGVGDTGSPYCIGGDSVYVKSGRTCDRLDLRTGRRLARFETPVAVDAEDRNWGYLAWHGGMLFGSVEDADHNVSPRYELSALRTESVMFFAIDPEKGSLAWSYKPAHSIRHNAIALADGKVVLIDRPIAMQDRVKEFSRRGRKVETLPPDVQPGGALICFDAANGAERWRNEKEIWGTQLAVSSPYGIVLMNYKAVPHAFFELPSEAGGRLAAFGLETGEPIWSRDATYKTRPIIQGERIVAQGGAWNLLTGDQLPWAFKRSYGCSQLVASSRMLLFRSATLGYADLDHEYQTENFGGMRPSCWINAIPASGMVLVPDGSAKCVCSYQMRSWFGLRSE